MQIASLTDRPSFAAWAARIQSLTFSTVIHVILVLLVGGTVVMHKVKVPDFASDPGVPLVADAPLANQPPTPQPQLDPTPSSQAPSISPTPLAPSTELAIITTSLTPRSFEVRSSGVPTPSRVTDRITAPSAPSAAAPHGGLSKDVAAKIRDFTAHWPKGGSATATTVLKAREFEFTAYLAMYQGGDWASTVKLEEEVDPVTREKITKVVKGSLPNLLYVISKLSKNKLHAEPQAEPLDLTSSEVFEKKPPFIWFTGHRDFVLTEKEVEVLGEYLRRGGCIWGDSSVPGQRSRFDIAFRREMLRLVPDANQPWQPLPPNHPIFTRSYYPEIRAIPPGINFYDEPIYTLLGYGGEIAVIYTANDYGDMWQFGIDEKGQIDLRRDEKREMVAVNEPMWHRSNLYYRNVESRPLFDSYKFGTNVIVHLLTRWEDKIRTVPQTR